MGATPSVLNYERFWLDGIYSTTTNLDRVFHLSKITYIFGTERVSIFINIGWGFSGSRWTELRELSVKDYGWMSKCMNDVQKGVL